MNNTSRRSFIKGTLGMFVAGHGMVSLAQQEGIASRGVKAQARPASSGRPFNAHFVDVAKAAGLNQPTIYGGVESKKYILEANGCGCALSTTTMTGGSTSSCFVERDLRALRQKLPIAFTKTTATGRLQM